MIFANDNANSGRAPRNNLHRHLATIVATDTGRQPVNHYRAAHPRRPHPRPPSPRIRAAHPVTIYTVTGYDGGHWHRAATSQPLSSSAPQAATPTATQSPDQSGAPSLHSHRHLATMVATDTRRQPGNHYWAAHPRRPHSRPPIHRLEPRPLSPIRWWTVAHGGRVAITEQQK